jgi:hypothetical protein
MNNFWRIWGCVELRRRRETARSSKTQSDHKLDALGRVARIRAANLTPTQSFIILHDAAETLDRQEKSA